MVKQRLLYSIATQTQKQVCGYLVGLESEATDTI